MSRFVDWLIARAMRTPYCHIHDYMESYWLLPYGWLPFAVRVHHILRSDNDRAFHDHPWPYITIILRGGYTEVTPLFNESGIYLGNNSVWRGAGSVLFRRARSWHRLEVIPGCDTWTLFITGPKTQSWGFMPQPEHKIYWRDYLNEHDDGGTP